MTPATNLGNQGTCLGNIAQNGIQGRSIGIADVAVTGTFVEARLNRAFIGQHDGAIRIRLTDANETWTADDDAIPFWTSIPAF